MNFWNSEKQAVELYQLTVPLIPAFTFLHSSGNGKARNNPQDTSIACVSRCDSTEPHEGHQGGASLFSFPGPAEVPEEPPGGRCSAARTSGETERLGRGLGRRAHRTGRSGASAPCLGAVCVSSCFLSNSSSQLDHKQENNIATYL